MPLAAAGLAGRRAGLGPGPRRATASLLRGHRRRRQGLSPRAKERRRLDRGSTTRPIPRCSPWPPRPMGRSYAGTGPTARWSTSPIPSIRPPVPTQGPVHLGPGRRRRRATCTRRPARRPALEALVATASGRSFYDSKATHLLCVAPGARRHGVRRQRRRGADLPGRPRRQGDDPVRRTSVGGPDSALAPDGALYAGTAAESGGGGSSRALAVLLARRRSRPGRVGRAIAVSRTDRGEQPGRQIERRAGSAVVIASRRQAGRGRSPRRAARPHPSRSRPATMPSTGSMPTACLARSSASRPWSTPSPGPDDRLLGRHRPRGPALRGPRPRRRDTPRRQARQRTDPLAPGRARRRHPRWERAIPAPVVRLSSGFAARASSSRRFTTPSS